MKKTLIAAALALASANASALVIDDFNSGLLGFPGVFATGPAGTDTDTQNGTMIGGSRVIDLEMLEGTGTSVVTVIEIDPGNGVLDIANGTTERSNVTVSWSFGATDFTDAGQSTGLFLALPNPIDNIMELTTVLHDGTNTSTNFRSFPDNSSGNDFFLPFSSFVNGIDLTAITSLTITITSPNDGLDTQIDLIETRPTPMPEPGTAFLLSAGLVGFWMRRKAQG